MLQEHAKINKNIFFKNNLIDLDIYVTNTMFNKHLKLIKPISLFCVYQPEQIATIESY